MFYEHLKNEAMIKKTIKLADALAQGYTHFGVADLGEFQTLRDLDENELARAMEQYPDRQMELAEKTGTIPGGIDERTLRDQIEDLMKCQYMDESGNDDDSDVTAVLKNVDFATLANAVTAAMATLPAYYKFDDLYVIP